MQSGTLWFVGGFLCAIAVLVAALTLLPDGVALCPGPRIAAAEATPAAAPAQSAAPEPVAAIGPEKSPAPRPSASQPADAPRWPLGLFARRQWDAREASLNSTLMTLRSQMALYGAQHRDAVPGVTPGGTFSSTLFAQHMTRPTNEDGAVGQADDRDYPLGSYLVAMPANPMAAEGVARTVIAGHGPSPRSGESGWYLDLDSGLLDRNDAAE